MNALAGEYVVSVLYSVRPRARKRIEERGKRFHPLVRAHRPFGFHDYIGLQKNALCVISDSGTLAEESVIFRFPAVSLRTPAERPRVVYKGVFTLGTITAEGLLRAVESERALAGRESWVLDYSDANTSAKVARIIQGYTST